ncbi:hypothetical protein M3J09_007086 [Ascochyta lentis]
MQTNISNLSSSSSPALIALPNKPYILNHPDKKLLYLHVSDGADSAFQRKALPNPVIKSSTLPNIALGLRRPHPRCRATFCHSRRSTTAPCFAAAAAAAAAAACSSPCSKPHTRYHVTRQHIACASLSIPHAAATCGIMGLDSTFCNPHLMPLCRWRS